MPTKQRLTKQHITQAHIIDSTKEHNPLLDYLAKHHPQTISEERLNLDALSQALGFSPSSMQGYGLSFIGKPLANALYSTPTTKELKELDPKHSQNIIIKGDNLHALKLLKSAYDGKIKMIYIDPPYNTKNEKFIYDDNFVKEYQKLLVELDLLKLDSNGKVLEKSEVLHFLTNPSGDKTHSGWLSFMLPRLKLARDLLKDDGVIFISIDDNEQANLKILCDEIFGEENFVCNVIWQKKKGGSQDSQHLAKEHEYILCYQKQDWEINEQTQEQNEKDFSKIINGKKAKILKLEKWGNHSLRTDRPTLYYAIKDPNGNDFYPVAPNGADGCWRKKPENLDKEHIFWQEDSKGRLTPYEVIYFDEVLDKQKIIKTRTIFTEFGTTTDATKEIQAIFGDKVFDTPKPVNLIKHLLKISTTTPSTSAGEEGDIVLDFFAGSGTTAHAVMELNKEDGGNRKFILVQLDELIDEKKSKTAYDFCKNTLKSKTPVISDITIERVKRAAAKIAKQDLLSAKELDLDFRLFTMVQKPELVSEENDSLRLIIHADLSPQDKALNLALQDSKMLHKKLESIIKDKLYQCENSLYIVKMDKEVLDYIKNKTHNEEVHLNAFDDIDLQEYLNLESHLKARLKVVLQ
ncbi:site-specific DNA-methyltransferase [Campylobacter felis]|uniref:site-specific DNA-methyltransferase n=1 Tax=Campylobacter felis TaxID=2974565 RepID=UPI00255ECDC2|nr:site-specific DNA-methyltransferase [Campylobacter felis]MDL0109841.1 site-specific DNA-methyltransferase [Campylobacter felis]